MKNTFKAKIHFYELEYSLDRMNEQNIDNTETYNTIKTLTDMIYPTSEDKFDTRWDSFYMPAKRDGRTIALPVSIMKYNKQYFISIHKLGIIRVKKGNKETEEIYDNIFSEIFRFIPYLKADEAILRKLIPYDIRTGKIKGQYILNNLISLTQKDRILDTYKKHLKKNLELENTSLNEYMDTASICYKAAYPKKTKNLTPTEMYKKWADGRDGGMLSIKDKNSRPEFTDWLKTSRHLGAHPFEIVFSWHGHGIHLYPPEEAYSQYYGLYITNYAYAPDYIDMLKKLIKKEVPFKARELEDVLNYLSGETDFTVNYHTKHNFSYFPSKEYKTQFFHHIRWDKINIIKWK